MPEGPRDPGSVDDLPPADVGRQPLLPALDRAILTGLEALERDGSPGLVADVDNLFVEQSERHLQAITTAIAERKRRLLVAHLHALGGERQLGRGQ